MPGFNFYFNLPYKVAERKENLICESIIGDGYNVNRFTVNKFMNDKLFIETEQFILVLDGIIINKIELLEKYQYDSWSELIWFLFKNDKEFFKLLRGTFCGLVYDKSNNQWIIFTDQLGTKCLYYYVAGSKLMVSSEIKDIYDYFKKFDIGFNLDINASYSLLTYGYMLQDQTLCSKIKKINPGSYVRIDNNNISFHKYYKLPLASIETNKMEFEIIEELDYNFRKAIKKQFEKDNEYNYRHIVALSGGLDSRMTSWVAHEMGFTEQLNFTFSQSDYLDETIPKKIAADLKHEWIFKALDNGIFLKDIEEINLMTGGNVLYYGLAHGNSMIKLLNFDNLGIIHSGQLGDIVIGSFISNFSQEALSKLDGAYSKKLLDKKADLKLSPEQIEHNLIYQRGINGANNGLTVSQKYTETISPFYDIDFFEFCLSIPIKLRMNHNIYKKWILRKYPKAGEYIWESTKRKIDHNEIKLNYKGHKISISELMPLVLLKLGLKKNKINSKHHMNPLDYWYATNKFIKSFQDAYFEQNINLIHYENLNQDCREMYLQGNSIEKNQVLTLLAAVKIFF